MFVTRVITDGGLKGTRAGFSLDIRVPWYRSLPVSTVSIAELKVDGQAIPATTFASKLTAKPGDWKNCALIPKSGGSFSTRRFCM